MSPTTSFTKTTRRMKRHGEKNIKKREFPEIQYDEAEGDASQDPAEVDEVREHLV